MLRPGDSARYAAMSSQVPHVRASESGLSYSQLPIWIGQQRTPDSPLYNMAFAFVFEGAIDADGVLRRLAANGRRQRRAADDRVVERGGAVRASPRRAGRLRNRRRGFLRSHRRPGDAIPRLGSRAVRACAPDRRPAGRQRAGPPAARPVGLVSEPASPRHRRLRRPLPCSERWPPNTA